MGCLKLTYHCPKEALEESVFFSLEVLGKTKHRPEKHTRSTPYKFNGKEEDAETGLVYYGARYYNAKLSVWLSVDPLAYKYPNLTPYNFVANNPIKLIDPDGNRIILIDTDSKEQEALMDLFKAIFGDRVETSVSVSGAKFGYNPQLNVSIAEGYSESDFSEEELGMLNQIIEYSKNDERLEVGVGVDKDFHGVDSWNEKTVYPENFKHLPNNVKGIGKLVSLYHFFVEQYVGQVENKNDGNYTKAHRTALERGLKIYGYTWTSNYAPQGANYEIVDVLDKNGEYLYTVKMNYDNVGTDKPVLSIINKNE